MTAAVKTGLACLFALLVGGSALWVALRQGRVTIGAATADRRKAPILFWSMFAAIALIVAGAAFLLQSEVTGWPA